MQGAQQQNTDLDTGSTRAPPTKPFFNKLKIYNNLKLTLVCLFIC